MFQKQQIPFWETSPFFRLLVPLAAGIVFYHLAGNEIYFNAWAWTCLLILGAYTIVVARKKASSASYRISFLLSQLILIIFGVILSWLGDVRNDNNTLSHHLLPYSKYMVRVSGTPTEKEFTWKIPVSIISVMKDNQLCLLKDDAIVYLEKNDKPMNYHYGDTLILPGRWETIKNAGNPFEFDYAGFCRLNNLQYQQFCRTGNIKLFGRLDSASLPWWQKAHNRCMSILDKYLPDPVAKGILQTMLLGDAVNLDEDMRQSYARAGIVYIIAISGGHVFALFLLVTVLLSWLKHRKYLWIKYLAAVPLVWMYILLANGETTAIRAAIMFSILAIGIIYDQPRHRLNTLFATTFLLLVIHPAWLFSSGFQLSLTAVLSFMLFYSPILKWYYPKNRILAWFYRLLAASLAVEILVAPIVAWYFHFFPATFLVSNILAYFFMLAVLTFSLAILVFSWCSPLATFIGKIATWIVIQFNQLVDWLQQLNPAWLQHTYISFIEVLLIYLVIYCFAMYYIKKQKVAFAAAIAVLCFLMILFCNDEWIRLNQYRFVVYNTAKTTHAELIRGPNYTVEGNQFFFSNSNNYACENAHNYWQSWEEAKQFGTEICRVKGKTILVLQQKIVPGLRFHADYLVINYFAKIQPEKLKQIFTPQEIIIGNNLTANQQQKWKEACTAAKIPLYIVRDSGALVLE